MKKKILMLVSVCLLAMCLGACGEEEKKATDFNGISYEALESQSQQMVQTLENYTDEIMDQYLEQTAESDDALTYNMIKTWKEAKTDAGSFVKYGDFDVSQNKETLTLAQQVEYQNKTVVVTSVYNAKTMEPESFVTDQVYTLSEKMERAGLNTVMGILTVFAILILISLFIYAFRIIPYLQNRKKNVSADTEASIVEQIVRREGQLQDDMELAAVISAAVAAATGSSTDSFVVRSIKRR